MEATTGNWPAELEEPMVYDKEDLETDDFLKKRETNIEKGVSEIDEKERDELIQHKKRSPLIQGCNSIESYLYLNKIHEGSYGVVFRAMDKLTGNEYAIKNIKIERNSMGYTFAKLAFRSAR